MIVFGTRPEVIKLAPVIHELRRRGGYAARICFTAQHRELCDPLLRFFSIRPDHDLDVMTENQSLMAIATRTMSRLDAVLDRDPAEMVIVQGDTTSAFAAALLAFYRRIPVAHVEAGLRTSTVWNPYPEEMNRRLVGRVAELHFAPTERARRALAAEGVPGAGVWVTGNTVIDALLFTRAAIRARRRPARKGLGRRRLILVTAHRRESFGRGIEEICAAIRDIAARNGDVEIFFPVHPNPAVRAVVSRTLAGRERIVLSPPVDYRELVRAMDESFLVLTDSGGLQEEAPALGKPVVVMRDETERPEIVAAGGAVLAGPHRDRIVAAVERLLHDPRAYARMARVRTPFGDGRAARRIVRVVDAWFRSGGKTPPGLRRTAEFRPLAPRSPRESPRE
ncbi:MAG: UDP-N-acetylglucosamine 2-epimerase (non-hydrolyzing) [Candidatus Latescibacterota bacterium]|nr:MAG: UDP-N-acetylglucosamine 2-epimerase (non-hydrolyzing) [Candidatus Latescibacterota bacterium]